MMTLNWSINESLTKVKGNNTPLNNSNLTHTIENSTYHHQFQPIVEIDETHKVLGYECFVRSEKKSLRHF